MAGALWPDRRFAPSRICRPAPRPLQAGTIIMKTHNLLGYAILLLQAAALAYVAPQALGPWLGMTLGMVYFTAIWFLSGVYLSDVIHMGITHGALDYKPWFIKTVTVVSNTVGIYVNPVTWVNRHRHHHEFADHAGDS